MLPKGIPAARRLARGRFLAAIASAMALAGCAGSADSTDFDSIESRHRHSSPTPSPIPTVSSIPSGGSAWGLTLDSVDGASSSQLAAVVTMLEALRVKFWVRFVIDNGSSASISNYTAAYDAISPHANIMWEICDSSYTKGTSLSTYERITSNFLAAFPNSALFEVGNELNGEWLGGTPYSGGSAATGVANPVIAKAYASWKLVAAAGKQSALTLYYEPPQTVTPGYDMVPWVQANFDSLPDMAAGLDKILISYYEVDNNNVRPTAAQWTTIFQGLQAVFPNAALGFGEIGLDNPVTGSTLASAKSVMSYYYGLKPSVNNWWGGFFWWYGQEDLVPASTALFTLLNSLV